MGSNGESGGMQPPPGREDPKSSKYMNSSGKVSFESMHRATTGTMADGGVKMELEPYSFESGIFRVKFYANTHTVNLDDFDMMELMHLEYENIGYKPASVDKMRGHHAGGEIEFRVPEVPDHFRIIVRDLPNMEQRVFKW